MALRAAALRHIGVPVGTLTATGLEPLQWGLCNSLRLFSSHDDHQTKEEVIERVLSSVKGLPNVDPAQMMIRRVAFLRGDIKRILKKQRSQLIKVKKEIESMKQRAKKSRVQVIMNGISIGMVIANCCEGTVGIREYYKERKEQKMAMNWVEVTVSTLWPHRGLNKRVKKLEYSQQAVAKQAELLKMADFNSKKEKSMWFGAGAAVGAAAVLTLGTMVYAFLK